MKKRIKILPMLMACAILTSSIGVQARQIITFNKFKVTYSGGEKYTSEALKATDTKKGVVNLMKDPGTAWITATMYNRDGVFRGSTKVQSGERKQFKEEGAKSGYYYKLGLKKTNNTGGGKVTISGSWSPDIDQ